MKKLFMAITAVALACNSMAIEKRFGGGWYQFEPSEGNTSAEELPMSSYKKGYIVFLRNDTAYMFKSKKTLDMDSAVVCPELTELKMEGTFAYDAAHKKIYFVKKTGTEATVLYEATEEDGKWKNIKQLNIEGTLAEDNKIVGSTLTMGRYNFTHAGVKGFHNPCLSRGGDRIYFSGDFKSGMGGRDIWFIDKNKDGRSWSRPQSAGDSTINSGAGDDYPTIVGDTALFFASARQGGQGGMDLYVSHKETYEKVWGPAKNLGEIFNSGADDYNVAYNGKAMYFLSKRSGGAGNADIYYPEHFNFQKSAELPIDHTIEEPHGFNWVLFFFDFNKSDMKPEYEVQLNELVDAMNEYPGESFVIRGYTDSRGSADYNLKLSQKRAEYIRQLLISRGFDGRKLKAVGRGMNDPVIPNATTEDEHEQNRRVEIQLLNTKD